MRSKTIMDSFQDAERRQELITMVHDLLKDPESDDVWYGVTRNNTNKRQRQQKSHCRSSTSHQRNNLARQICPKDATSIIRLLGRNHAHDAMLQFCRRYCRDILFCYSVPPSSSSILNKVKDETSCDEAIYFMSHSEVMDAIRFAYTAVIAECAKPPKRHHEEFSMVSNYRTKNFLLSLLNEMEYGYSITASSTPKNDTAQDIHNSLLQLSILLNSYTLSAVLLGIDDVTESMAVLEGFEDKYGKNQLGYNNSGILSVQVYNVVIASCSKDSSSPRSSRRQNGSGWQRALSILQRMRRSGPQPNEETYSMILQACAMHGQMKVAFSLLDEIRTSSRIPLSIGFYLPLLKVCAKMGDHTKAKLIIDMVKDDNSLGMTTEIFNLYLLSFAKQKNMHTYAMEVLQQMIDGPSITAPPPDIVSFNNVLAAYANAGDYDGAQSLLDEMKLGLYDVIPDVVSYNTLISCADPSSALFLIQEMRLTRRHREGIIIPNSVTYVNAISQCRKACFKGDEDEMQSAYEIAMHLLDLASENYGKGVELNVFVYSASIWMAEAVGDYHSAVKLLREMKCHPNNVCYDGVISVLSKQGLHREALYLYYEMQNKKLSASRKTYQMLVYAIDHSLDTELSSQKKAALLDGLLSVMPIEDRSVQVGGPLFEAIIRNHGNDTESSSSYHVARMAFDSIVGPVDDACLCAMLRVCSSIKPTKWNEAVTLIHSSDILSDAQIPGLVSSRALSLAVTACAKADQWAEALNLMELYGRRIDEDNRQRQSRIVSVAAVNSVIRACGRKLRPDVANLGIPIPSLFKLERLDDRPRVPLHLLEGTQFCMPPRLAIKIHGKTLTFCH